MTGKSLGFLDSGSEFLLSLENKKEKGKDTYCSLYIYIYIDKGRQTDRRRDESSQEIKFKARSFFLKSFETTAHSAFLSKLIGKREKAKEKKRKEKKSTLNHHHMPLPTIIYLNNLLFLHCHYHSLYLINVLFFFFQDFHFTVWAA